MNTRNTAIKRIMADVRELERHPSSRYSATPLEDNMFEWHFTIRGPSGSDFEGGIYHGRILLPAEYPFKPPNIIFLTKNGRFEVGTKICLSISAYHEETWQPAWGGVYVCPMCEHLLCWFGFTYIRLLSLNTVLTISNIRSHRHYYTHYPPI
jgi:ubiquitin-protein ligase